MAQQYTRELVDEIKKVTSKRPRLVLDHIVKNGSVTTEELREVYGYDHPPRAARDVRESGIPLRTEMIMGRAGRRLARYTIDVAEFKRRRNLGGRGRRAMPAQLKRQLVKQRGNRCELCLSEFESSRPLQVDHRVPYEVGGDPPLDETDRFMLACAPCNRAKSWQCEHCPNWTKRKKRTCGGCFWANPGHHSHAGTRPMSVVLVHFGENDSELLDELRRASKATGTPVADAIKLRLRKSLDQEP